MATLAALGVGLFSLRDFMAAERSARLVTGEPAALVASLAPHQHLLITGGTGFIGQRLVQALVVAGHHVTILTRNPCRAEGLPHPVRLISDLSQISTTERFDAIINLAGEPVANGLWTARKRKRIIQSRVYTTQALNALIRRLNHKPSSLINGSAVGWYGLGGDEPLTEAAPPSPAFVHQVCDALETAASAIAEQGVRVVYLRIGLVLGVQGGILGRLLTPFEFGGGCQLGDGRQWMPWIELDDLVRAIAFTLSRPDISGPVNATAPHPVRNSDFTRALARALRRPVFLRAPGWLITSLAGEMGRETLLSGQRVLPNVLQAKGFVFIHPYLAPALATLTGAKVVKGHPAPQKRPI